MRACEAGGQQAGILDGFISEFQHDALLGVDAECLARRNSEEGCIEGVDVGEAAGGEAICLAWLSRDWVKIA